jgi:hypothetical protein
LDGRQRNTAASLLDRGSSAKNVDLDLVRQPGGQSADATAGMRATAALLLRV